MLLKNQFIEKIYNSSISKVFLFIDDELYTFKDKIFAWRGHYKYPALELKKIESISDEAISGDRLIRRLNSFVFNNKVYVVFDEISIATTIIRDIKDTGEVILMNDKYSKFV